MNDEQTDSPSREQAQGKNDTDSSKKSEGVGEGDAAHAEKEDRATGKIPTREEEAQKIKEDLEHSSVVNRSLLIFFLLAMTYFLVIVASTKDLQMLLPNSTIKLPILNVDLDLIKFYLFSPFILTVIHYNFLFSLCQHTKKLVRLKKLETQNDDPLPHSSFLINLLIKPIEITKVNGQNIEASKDNRMPYYLIRILLWIVIYLYPLSILVLFQWRFASYHDLRVTFVHFLYIVLDIALLSFFWIRIVDMEYKHQLFKIFRVPGDATVNSGSDGGPSGESIRKRRVICSADREKIDRIFLFFPCLVKTTLWYMKKNTGTVNLVIICLLALVQVRTFGLLMLMDYLPTGVAYRIVNKYDFLAIPRLEVIDQPIVAHYRKLSLPLPYSDSVESLKQPLENFLSKSSADQSPPDSKASSPPTNIGPCESRPEEPPLNCFDEPLPGKASTGKQLDLSHRDLRFAILDRSDLTHVLLKEAQLQGASMIETKLDHARMDKALLQDTNLTRARLRKAWLPQAHLEEAILEGACMQTAILERAFLDGADMTNANLEQAFIGNASLVGTIMKDANLSFSTADWTSFRAADLSGANFSCASIQGGDFSAADLSAAKLPGAKLVDANFQAANLTDCDLSQATMLGANMYAANMTHANFDKANLTGADLRYGQIQSASIDLNALVVTNTTAPVYGLNVYEAELDARGDESGAGGEEKMSDTTKIISRKISLTVALGSSPAKGASSNVNQDSATVLSKEEILAALKNRGAYIIHQDNETEKREYPFEVQVLSYRLRFKIACGSVFAARGILRQLLFEKDLEYQRRRMFSELGKRCPLIAAEVTPH